MLYWPTRLIATHTTPIFVREQHYVTRVIPNRCPKHPSTRRLLMCVYCVCVCVRVHFWSVQCYNYNVIMCCNGGVSYLHGRLCAPRVIIISWDEERLKRKKSALYPRFTFHALFHASHLKSFIFIFQKNWPAKRPQNSVFKSSTVSANIRDS